MSKQNNSEEKEVFNKIKNNLIAVDPVKWIEKYLTIDGKPFNLTTKGYKPFADMYRYIGIKALEKGAKPLIILKARQLGMTTMSAALEMYFMGCGLFGTGSNPPIRVMHAFPFLELAAAYSKTKLQQMINASVPIPDQESKKGAKLKTHMQARLDTSAGTNDSLHFKQFTNGNHLWIESIGLTGDRVMGRQLCLETELPTPNGFIKLKDLKEGDDLFDENGNICQTTKLHPINTSPEAYRITFDDGTTVDACADHLWKIYINEINNLNIVRVKNTKFIYNNISKNIKLKSFISGIEQIFKIISVEKIESKPMRCITVNSASHLFLITKSCIPTHNTADVMIYDEVQSTSDMAIGNSIKILTTSPYGNKGVQVFFGTPRQKGSSFQKRWQASTQQYYHLHCEKCKEYFPLYTPGSDDWEKIWLHGYIVKCPHCGCEQDKRAASDRGKWVGLKDEDDDDVKLIGFHVNQLFIPWFTKEDVLAEKPGIHPVNNERAWQNEILGEFYQGDSSPISIEEITEHCADLSRKMSASLDPGNNEIVICGIDYGAKSDMEQMANPEKNKKVGKSYSTAVVIAVRGAGLISVEYATKFARNDATSKRGIIETIMRKYNTKVVVADIGFSNDFSEAMHLSHGERYLVSRASGKINNHVKFASDAFPKEIQFEKNFFISEVFEQMKKGMIRFPYGHYDEIGWLIEHCSSMDIKASLSKTGDPSIHYEKGSTPNDGLMALINAYLGYKFIITQGFTKKMPNSSITNVSVANKQLITGGYVSKRF